MHYTRHHQRDQAGPQQWDVGVVVRSGSQYRHQFGVGLLLDAGNRLGDLALLVFTQ